MKGNNMVWTSNKFRVLIVLVFAVFFINSVKAQFTHPGIMFTMDDLDRMKAMKDIEPWKTSYDAFRAKNTASVNYKMQGPFETVSRDPHIHANEFSNDMMAVHDQALMWYMTGDETYINKAKSILYAWASTHTTFEGATPALLSGDGGMLAVIGAEIIRYVYGGWDPEELETCTDYFLNVIYRMDITNDMPAPEILGQSNQGASRLKSMIAIAVFLDDKEKFDYTIAAFRGEVADAYCVALERNSLPSGQQAEAGLDQGHPLGAIQNYAQCAEIAWKQGIDLYGDLDNRLLSMMEYWSKYNLGDDDVPFESFAPCRLSYSSISSANRSNGYAWAPVEMIYAHYAGRKGMSAPYTKQYREGISGSKWDKKTFFYRNEGSGELVIDSLIIQAEAYTNMSEVETEICTDRGDGKDITSIHFGDWMEYEIQVPFSGNYSFQYRVASASSDGSFILTTNSDTLDQVGFLATGGNQTWATEHSANSIFLSKGRHIIRLTAGTDGWNINWISLHLQCAYVPVITKVEEINTIGESSIMEQVSSLTVYPWSTVKITPETLINDNWKWSGPNDFTAASRILTLSDIQKNQGGEYRVTYTNNCGLESHDTINIHVQDSLYIEAEDYSAMSGIVLEDTEDVSGNSNITEIDAGDWLEYEISIPFSATYTIDYRVAGENMNGIFEVMTDNRLIDQISFEKTGGAQSWVTVSSALPVYLKEGVHTIRVTSKTDGWKINWLRLNATELVKKCNFPTVFDGFEVKNNTVNWTSGMIDISCESEVNIHVFTQSSGSLGASDYLNIYYKLDNGELIPVAEKSGSIDELRFTATKISGTILEVIVQSKSESTNAYYTISGIEITKNSDPFARIEAEEYDEAIGTKIENCNDIGGGKNLGSIKDGDWAKYRNINLNEVRSINARIVNNISGGAIEVRLDSESGLLIGTIDIPNTGVWQAWVTVSVNLDIVAGFHDVYLVFKSPNSWVGNINWFQFSSASAITSATSLEGVKNEHAVNLYPNPVEDFLTIEGSINSRVTIFNTLGQKVFEDVVTSNRHSISTLGLKPGIYLVKLISEGAIKSGKFLKK
jgi:hypothetical protein